MLAYIFDDAHKLSFFSVHDGKHIERESFIIIYSIWDNKAYVCVFFLYLVHLLYHEIGLN